MTGQFFLNNLWRDLVGLPEEEWITESRTPEEVRQEIKHFFEPINKLCENRMLLGSFRHKTFLQDDEGMYFFEKCDLMYQINKRLDKFKEDSNLEHLLDVRNFVTLAYLHFEKLGYKMNGLDEHNFHSKKIV
jgi:hypothetical protein